MTLELIIMLFVTILLSYILFSTAEIIDNDVGCDLGKNCSEGTVSCIKNYEELELYVTSSSIIVEQLKSAFFFTGEDSVKFVKLIYNFKVSNNSLGNCSNQTTTYIWSESALYLLGNTLVWTTFFALDISGYRITVDLPCLCHDDYGELISRLTYMVQLNIDHNYIYVCVFYIHIFVKENRDMVNLGNVGNYLVLKNVIEVAM